jgi:hypothetical protein
MPNKSGLKDKPTVDYFSCVLPLLSQKFLAIFHLSGILSEIPLLMKGVDKDENY